MLGGGLGHALQPAQLLVGLGQHLSGMPDSAIAFFRSSTSAAVPSSSPSSFDGRELLAQDRLALALFQRAARRLAELARQAQNAQALVEKIKHPVDTADEVEGLKHLLLLAGADVHGTGHQIRELAGRADAANGIGELARRLRQQFHRLQRSLAQEHEPRLDLLALVFGLVDQLEAGGQERVAAGELEDAEALLALADQVMVAVGRRHVAQHVGRGADTMEIEGPGSSTPASRCRTTPIGRSPRTPACAAAIERGRAIVTGTHGTGKENQIADGHQRQDIRRQYRW